jgi:hypothetical protein
MLTYASADSGRDEAAGVEERMLTYATDADVC